MRRSRLLGFMVGFRPIRPGARKVPRQHKLYDSAAFSLYAYKAGKGERFHWRPLPVPHWGSLSQVQYDKDFSYNVTHFTIPTRIQFFFLWFIVDLKIKRKYMSKAVMVHRADTIIRRDSCAAEKCPRSYDY